MSDEPLADERTAFYDPGMGPAYEMHVQGDGSGRNWWATVTAELALLWGRRAAGLEPYPWGYLWVHVEPVRPGYQGPVARMMTPKEKAAHEARMTARMRAAVKATEWRGRTPDTPIDQEWELCCPSRRHHGACIPRPSESLTPEQQWCGTWYDCPHCSSSVLVMSLDLKVYLDAQADLPRSHGARPEPVALQPPDRVPPCPCECNHGGFCGGCGHAGCGRR